MTSDRDIERNVKEELQWNPDLDATDIAVSVKNGVVTLAGFVRSYTDKYEAETAAKRVAGVAGVANDIEVRMPSVDERPDPEIARDAVAAIKSQLPISSEHIKVVVKNGWVTLEGQVEWQYQRSTAETAVRRIKGVKGVSNLIQIKPRAAPAEIKKKIQEAFKRNAEVDANRIRRDRSVPCGRAQGHPLQLDDFRPCKSVGESSSLPARCIADLMSSHANPIKRTGRVLGLSLCPRAPGFMPSAGQKAGLTT